MEKSSVLKPLFKGVVLLSALGILATYVRHTQHEADAMRAELADVKALLLQQAPRATKEPASTFQPTPGVVLSESHSWQPDSRPVLTPMPAPDILNLFGTEAETINPINASALNQGTRYNGTMISSSKSAVIKPSYPVSAWRWLFDLNPRKTEPTSDSRGSPLTRTESGLTQEDLEKLSKSASPLIRSLIEPSLLTSPQMFDSSKSGRIFTPYSTSYSF